MKLSIIVADNSVAKNEEGYVGLDLSTCSIPANVWALQWNETSGHIEYQGQGPNTEIDELPNWATAVEAKWQVAEDAKVVTEEKATPIAEAFWDNYPVANVSSVDSILLKTYEGITNVRGADPVTNVVKTVETVDVAAGSTALTSLATLLDDCKALGVPVTSDKLASDTTQNFKDYMEGLGYTLYSGVDLDGVAYEKVYYPWSDDLAAKKADQDVNIARTASLAEGVEWNGSNWQIDLNSRNNVMNQLTAITSGVYTDATVTWRNTANVDVELTVDEFKELAGAVNAKVEEIYLASFAAKA